MNKDIKDYDRVTAVLYHFSNMHKINPIILKNAANRGQIIHQCCDAIIENIPLMEINPDWNGYIESFEKWSNDKKFVKKPPRLYCDTHQITGEIDGLYENENGLTLFDLKTSASESLTWQFQGSAYKYLCNLSNLNITKIEFVKLSKFGKNPISYFYSYNFEYFLICLEVFRRFFKNEKIQDSDFI